MRYQGMKDVECLSFGPVLIHPKPKDWWEEDADWIVTHRGTGRMMVDVTTFEDALRCAEVFLLEGFKLMKMKDLDKIRKEVPKWMREWSHHCKKDKKYVDHEQYKEQNKEEE